jgi:hypothetical protein
LTGQPIWNSLHFCRQRASPFQVDYVSDIPLVIHKNIALMNIREDQQKWTLAKVVVDEMMEE